MRLALSLILACLLVANVRGSEPSPANADSAEKELDALKMKLAAIMRAVDLIRAAQEFNYHVDVQRRHPKLDDAALYKARDAMLKHGKAYMSGIRDLETPLYGDADLGRANFAAMEIFSET